LAEHDSVALRPDQLVTLANTLGVTTDYLVGRATPPTRGMGPVGKAKRLFDSLSKLPRHQQEKIFAILEPFIMHHVNENTLRPVHEAGG